MRELQSLVVSCVVALLFVAEAGARSHEVVSTKPIGLICVTEFPSTSFVVTTEGSYLKVQVLHHNGTKYMPIWDSVATPEDIPAIQQASAVLQKLGDSIAFRWKASECKSVNDLMFQCVGQAEDFEVNGIQVHPWALSVSEVTESTIWGSFFHRNLTLSMTIAEKTYRISMNYGEKDCYRPEDIPSTRRSWPPK